MALVQAFSNTQLLQSPPDWSLSSTTPFHLATKPDHVTLMSHLSMAQSIQTPRHREKLPPNVPPKIYSLPVSTASLLTIPHMFFQLPYVLRILTQTLTVAVAQ